MKISKFFLTIFHLGVLVLLLATTLNAYISPQQFPFLNLLSLAFPVLFALNIIFCFFWIITRQKRVLVFLLFSLLLISCVGRWINWNMKSDATPNLKIVTLNMKGGHLGRTEIYNYLENSGADIIFCQEYGKQFDVPNYKFTSKENNVTVIKSKYEIIKFQNLKFNDYGYSMFADIRIAGKIVRVFNIYLQPFSFDKQKLKPSENLEKNELKMKYAIKTLVPTFKIHQQEIEVIRKEIDASPYPVIVAGDFNSVPNSYEYYSLKNDLTDAFSAVGSGSSTSFHDYKFPIRIDFIFSSNEIKPISYKVDRSVKISDHFPVIGEFHID